MPEPFYYQPDREKPPHFLHPTAEKLVRRGPREFYLIGRRPDGSRMEIRLLPVRLQMPGF